MVSGRFSTFQTGEDLSDQGFRSSFIRKAIEVLGMKILMILFLISGAATVAAEEADLVLKNGTVTTMEASLPKATAIAITGEKVIWVGEEKGAGYWIGKKTKVIDLKGAYVYPGLIDSHAHIISLGGRRVEIDLLGTEN